MLDANTAANKTTLVQLKKIKATAYNIFALQHLAIPPDQDISRPRTVTGWDRS